MSIAEADAPIPLTADFMQDPYPLYVQLRKQGPAREVVMPNGLKVWMVTRYEDARVALTDPAVSKDFNRTDVNALFQKHSKDNESRPRVLADALAAHMLNSDPPDHTRLRNLVTKAFTARTVSRLRPRVEQITDELLDAMARHTDGRVDLLDAFAFPLPITVICELLGVPQTDRDDFREWSNTLVSNSDSMQASAAAEAMSKYLFSLIDSKRDNPGEDLLTALIQASADGDRLDQVELVSMAFLLMVAGHETTVNLIGNGVLALLRNPDQLALLREDPDLIAGAVEEFLRFNAPVNTATIRYTTAPLRLGEVEIPEDEFVLVSLGSANHDGDRFAQPDRLDITRKATTHLAFGHGIHYCLGAPLARIEGQIAIGKLIERFPGLALAAEPETLAWRNSTLIRGLMSLPVSLR